MAVSPPGYKVQLLALFGLLELVYVIYLTFPSQSGFGEPVDKPMFGVGCIVMVLMA